MNGEKQFAVQVVMSDGSTERPALQWVATGGSVGSEGFYKAGKSPGRYRVIARTFDGRLADTAKVVILDGPASPPPAPPPPPPPASGSCSDGSYVRLVTVSSASSLAAALSNAQPGDRIVLADGKYVGRFKATKQGTSARPITVCGSSNAILDGGSLDGGYGLHLDGARYWVFRGFTITNAMKGVILDQAYYNEVDGLTVHDIRDEVVHLRKHSSYNVIRNNHLYRGGRGSHHGEGIYLGSAESNWCTYTDCQPDNVTNNKVLNNLIEDMTAEGIEAKEATRNNLFDGNTIRRAGQQLSSSGSMGATASIAVRGGSSTFSNNVVEGCSTTCPVNGVQVYSGGGAGDGDNNTFTDNIVDVRSSGYGFSIHSSQVGNVVGCDNVVRNAARGSWNIGCK